ncbi:hypothetical protein PHMEG_00010828 [Phytophthora megakarya]|uniref:Uncharacterized protein n=1 Tax=Phytophthora megakarya TaxID=4795 RepID=A0A225WF65_9STRA|nr:hypothetical protein PHMEG_00010828 [Phytophthora megakarya]
MTDVEDNAQVPERSVDIQAQTNCSIPVQRLEAEYARVMRVSAEELDLEPAVYLREGSDFMAQLRDQLIMLPEIEELTPECNIDEGNVGVPGITTTEMEAKMRGILKRDRSIFLEDGNAAPAPARGAFSCFFHLCSSAPASLGGQSSRLVWTGTRASPFPSLLAIILCLPNLFVLVEFTR